MLKWILPPVFPLFHSSPATTSVLKSLLKSPTPSPLLPPIEPIYVIALLKDKLPPDEVFNNKFIVDPYVWAYTISILPSPFTSPNIFLNEAPAATTIGAANEIDPTVDVFL